MRLCLVEDSAVKALEPLSLTRPVFDLLLGSRSLGQKVAHAFGVDWNSTRRGALIRPHLVAQQRAIENCARCGSQKHRVMNRPNRHADSIMYVVNNSDLTHCMTPFMRSCVHAFMRSTGQPRKIGDTRE